MSEDAARKTELDTILKLRVPVIVQLGQRAMPVEHVLGLAPGAIVELQRTANTPLDLMINNKQIGQGTAVKIGENFGLSILNVGNVTERIEAMGQSSGEPPLAPDAAPAEPDTAPEADGSPSEAGA